MRLLKQKGLHEAAREYYYDLLAECDPDVPASIVHHVRRCLLCRRRMLRLEKAIVEVGGEAYCRGSQMGRDVIDTLSLHFRYLGEHVTCARARPLLPGLLSLSRIRIPTPITVHVDHCPSCAEDLETIRRLSLDEERLRRLEWLYGQPSEEDLSLCAKAESAIPAFAGGAIGGIDRAVLRHLCTCPSCRSRVYDSRQRLQREMSGETAEAACESDTSTADLFDCLIPCDLTGADAQRPANSHVYGCVTCLERLQSLHREIYGIAERADSGIATVYNVAEVGRTRPASSDSPYADYPVNVEVIRRTPEPAPEPSPPPAAVGVPLSRKTANSKVRFLLKATIAAVVVIPLAILFFATRTATGITLAQVFQAFGKVRNIHILRLYAGTDDVPQELWISRSLNCFIMKTGSELVLYDLAANYKKYAGSAAGPGSVSQLTDEEYAFIQKRLIGSLGFSLDDVPVDADWSRVGGGVSRYEEVYELSWADRTYPQSPLLLKFRITIDPSTQLPREICMFRKRPNETEWDCRLRRYFQYVTEEEITVMLRRDFLLDAGRLPAER